MITIQLCFTWAFFVNTQPSVILINEGKYFNTLAMHAFSLLILNLIYYFHKLSGANYTTDKRNYTRQ